MDGFPSGQRGQTVNLLAPPSKVRILLHPLIKQRVEKAVCYNQNGLNASPTIHKKRVGKAVCYNQNGQNASLTI